MPITVYLDTNAWLDLVHRERREKQGLRRSDLRLLHNAVIAGRVRVALSVYVIEELVAKASGEGFPDEIRFITDIASRDGFVKEPKDLATEHIDMAIQGIDSCDDFYRDDSVRTGLERLQCQGMSLEAFCEITRFAHEQSESFKQALNDMRKDLRKKFEEMWGVDPKAAFEDEYHFAPTCLTAIPDRLWELIRDHHLQNLVNRVEPGLVVSSEQRTRLLADKCISHAIDYPAARTYEVFFLKHKYAAKATDSRDSLHWLSACVADVFVTSDVPFAGTLGRIPQSRTKAKVVGLPDLFDLCKKRYQKRNRR